MQSYQSNVIARPDTLLGVCQALGEDFGFNPLFLRVAFAAPLLVDPVTPVAIYLSLGLLVAASRFFHPNPRAAVATGLEETSRQGGEQLFASGAAHAPSHEKDEPELAVAA